MNWKPPSTKHIKNLLKQRKKAQKPQTVAETPEQLKGRILTSPETKNAINRVYKKVESKTLENARASMQEKKQKNAMKRAEKKKTLQVTKKNLVNKLPEKQNAPPTPVRSQLKKMMMNMPRPKPKSSRVAMILGTTRTPSPPPRCPMSSKCNRCERRMALPMAFKYNPVSPPFKKFQCQKCKNPYLCPENNLRVMKGNKEINKN